jgi:type I restriction enzyme, S subunit
MELMAKEKTGFRKTEVGLIPEDWELKEFGEITEPSNTKISSDQVNTKLPCIELEHVKKDVGQIEGYSNLKEQKSQKTRFNKGDVLFGKLRPYLRKFYFAEFNGACSTEIWVFDAREGYSNKYLYYLVQRDSFIEAANKSTGTHMPRADWNVIKEHPVALPPTLAEQQAIASALSDVDELIRSLDGLIQKKQSIKKGTMQQLLSGKKRLPGFDGEWDIKELGASIYIQSGYSFKSVKFKDNGVPIVRISNIKEGYIDLSDAVFYSTDEEIPSDFVIEKGEALIAMSGATTGKVGLYINKKPSYQNQRVGKFVVKNKNKTDSSFILHLVSSDLFKSVLRKELEQGAQPNVSARQIEGLEFNFPEDIEEQNSIAQILSDMDRELQTLRQKREKYVQIKQGMMQQLLTGRIRIYGMDG